ncbi:MAG: helix-turn-helix transcriptional regulator [Lachnospiraceae bacterium]|nr:helix-turn-helix domain-containing protein [Lachnospiraceae bacterium]MDD7379411.1 helix-turn-helix transcriptional regulator [Lachnospiraceae bacterium]MDY4618071.1 helix-turn-helix transcriptional regulator [Lachnospiraceae bacterium]
MYEDFFSQRITELRLQKNVSAREMSLALGQNGSYINRIENKQAFPSMQAFFYICEYFGITPREFFDSDNLNPTKLAEIVDIVSGLNEEQLDIVLFVAKGLSDKTKP